jgi:hypothetical protein
MADYSGILEVCKEVNTVSAEVVDKFLMYYAAAQERLDKKMDILLARFRPVTGNLPQSWVNLIKAQYICHLVFKKDGLIKKYLNHAAVKALPAEQLNFLRQHSAHPWRYSYSIVISNPEKDFYEMEDVFNGETFLLHSPSVTQTLSEGSVSLWFNLIMYNGACWQTFGPILPFRSFEPDDIFFFATELNPFIETEEDLMTDLEENPFPYLMLISASNYPFTVHGKDEIIQLVTEHPLEVFDSSLLKPEFKLEYAKGIYRISNVKWSEPPHFAIAYYSEEKKSMMLTAMTDRGLNALVKLMNKHGFKIPIEPDIRVHLPMLIAIKNILGKDLKLNPYEKLFEHRSTPAEYDKMARLNHFLKLALPFINSGKEPDVEALAKEAGVDIKTARDLLKKSIGRIKILRKRTNKKGRESAADTD